MKKILIGFVAVFIAMTAFDMVVHGILLSEAYKDTASIWRPDMESKMWIYSVISLIGAFFFSFIFSKGYEGKGIAEGARYGLYIGIWMSVGMAYGTYGMIAIPYSMAMQWFLYGVIGYVIYGVILALIFGKKEETKAAG
ncbi:MAG: hypothetical protein M0R68_10265 [Bacteroidetes bacterium]|nr:hypothetical protein [Bacteroidota bacterium]